MGGEQCLEPILVEEWVCVSQEGAEIGAILAQAIKGLRLRRCVAVSRRIYVIEIERCVAAP